MRAILYDDARKTVAFTWTSVCGTGISSRQRATVSRKVAEALEMPSNWRRGRCPCRINHPLTKINPRLFAMVRVFLLLL